MSNGKQRDGLTSLTPNPAKIIRIDHCEPLLDLANGFVDDEATRHVDVRNTVQFRRMNAFGFGNQANVNAIQALFPRGISTIVAMDIFDNVSDDVSRLLIRNLTALLRPGGRVVLGLQYQPKCWSAAHFVRKSAHPPYLVGIINLAPAQFIQDTKQQAHVDCEGINGTATTGTRVAIHNLECEWLGNIWESFISTSSRYSRPGMISVNDEAWFDPVRRRFQNVAHPRIRYGDSAREYCRESIGLIIENMQPPRGHEDNGMWVENTSSDLNRQVFGSQGLWRLERLMRSWIHGFVALPRPDDDRGAWRAASVVITDNQESIVEQHNLDYWDEFYLTPASVLVCFRRV